MEKMYVYNVKNLPARLSHMANRQLSELTYAMSVDKKIWQVINVGEDEVALVSVTALRHQEMAGLMSVRELMAEFKDGYFALSFDAELDEAETSFMSVREYMDRLERQ